MIMIMIMGLMLLNMMGGNDNGVDVLKYHDNDNLRL